MNRLLTALLFAVAPAGLSASWWTDLVDEMLSTHPELAQSRAVADAAGALVEGSEELPDPRLEVGLYVSEIETRVGPQRGRLSLNQTLPWKDKRRLRGQLARAGAAASGVGVVKTRERLLTEFKTLWSDYFYLNRALALSRDHLSLLADLEEVLLARYRTNSAAYNDLIRLEIEIERLRDAAAGYQDAVQPLRAALNGMLGRSLDQPLSPPRELPPMDVIDGVDGVAENPLLLQHRFHTEAAGLQTQLAALAKKPDPRIGLDWIETGSGMDGVRGSGRDTLILRVGVDLPFGKRRYRAAEAAAAAGVTAAGEAARAARLNLELELERARFQMMEAERKATLYGERIVPKAREALEVGYSAFQTGDIGFSDLIEAEQELLTLLLTQHRAEADRVIAAARIAQLQGRAGGGEASYE